MLPIKVESIFIFTQDKVRILNGFTEKIAIDMTIDWYSEKFKKGEYCCYKQDTYESNKQIVRR